MPSFSIPPPFDRLFVRKRALARMAVQLAEQQPANEAARVIHALRLADPEASAESLAARAGEAMTTPIGLVENSASVPRPASMRLYLVRDSFARGIVEVVYRRANRDVQATRIDTDGKASGVGYMEFGDLADRAKRFS